MSKPDGIPQDVWDAARTWLQRIDSRDLDECAGIARAILAERKRCARAADKLARQFEDGDGDARFAAIAAAIRGGTAPIGAAATQSDGGGE